MKKSKKVRRVSVEKLKNGKGGHLHKVTTEYHDEPAKEGKGMKHVFPRQEPPEETYHGTHAAAKKHMHKMMSQMTATPEEQPVMGDQGGVSEAGARRNDAADVGEPD